MIGTIDWQPGIGDPTLLAWTTVYAYICAGLLSLLCTASAPKIFQDQHTKLHRTIWGLLTIGLFALGVNKQLDLQTLFTTLAKQVAYHQGWYDRGQSVQTVFIMLMIGMGGLGFLVLGWLVRSVWQQYWLLLVGGIALLRFIVVRAATFYGVALPQWSHFTGGLQINWLLELLAVAIIIVAALLNLVQYKRA